MTVDERRCSLSVVEVVQFFEYSWRENNGDNIGHERGAKLQKLQGAKILVYTLLCVSLLTGCFLLATRSSEKSNRQSRKQKTDSACDSVAYDQVKTALSELKAEAEE